jgi:hypothetical protein
MTYDGSGGADPATEFRFYLDGDELTTTAVVTNNSSGYVAMEPISEEFHIGASRSGDTEIDGDMAEFAIWGTELTSDHVKAIYYAQYDLISETITYNSGYTDLSPRIKIRDMDNRPGCYPSKHRMGDRDRSGKNNIFYEDLPIQFGDSIKDDFTKVPTSDLITDATGFDGNKWVVSTGMTIRREAQIGNEGVEIIDRCATFSGAGTGGKRFLRTSKPIRNITRMYFELIQGPYNQGAILLDLRKGNEFETLKLQISTDSSFSSPATIATYTPDAAFGEFYGEDYDVNTPPRKKITLHSEDFLDPGQAYFLRFVQETFDSNYKKVWAIPVVEIYYANQNIRYPTLLNHATGHNKFVSASISTPHTDSDLSGVGRAVKGISDIANPFQDFSETITAFDETLTQDMSDQFFRSQGVNPSVYPGFSSPTKSKTKFTIDLNPSEETTFGVTNQGTANGAGQAPGDDTSGTGQNYMVYWNKDLRRWEPIGLQPTPRTLHGGNLSPTIPFENYKKFVMEKATLGFGPIKAIFRETSAGVFSVVEDEVAVSYSKPINSFLFPFGNQYVATASNYVLAEDLGITKPFLLEKLAIDFQAKLQFPGTVDNQSTYGEHANAYSGSYLNTSNGLARLSGRSARKISFFLLRQFDDEKEIDYIVTAVPAASPSSREDFNRSYQINSGSSRELISYGQLGVFLTGSDYDNLNTPTIDAILNSPLSGDNNLVIEDWDQSSLTSVTGSYSLNFKSRNTARFKSGASFNLKLATALYPLLQKNNVGRGDGSLTSNSRAIVNGLNGEGESVEINADGTIGSTAHTKREFIDLDSPYLINPKDKLIFGWQYPPAYNLKDSLPIVGDSGFSNMTLFGKSKLQLYGSELVENKEFHETVNQNLTSCAVYEHIIGDEKIVDQWQVAYRGELTGSIIGQTNFGVPGMRIHTPLSTTYTYAYSHDFVSNNLSDFVNNENTTYRVNNLNKGSPVFRIGLFTFTPSKGFESFDEIPGISTNNAKIYYNFAKSSEKHLRFRDQDRIYEDSRLSVGNFYDDSSYGTLIRTHDLSDTSQNIFKDTRPKYRFNYRHFGYYADMFQQGKDSKVISSGPVNDGIEANFDPPVALTQGLFVSGSFTALGIKTYTKKQTDFFLDFFYFQSSNLNQFMTSSIPFIDDDTPRNRTYITREFIAFNAETTTLGS